MSRRIPSRTPGSRALKNFSIRRRGVRVLLSAGLLSGLLGTPAAFAAEPPSPEVRAAVVGYWRTGGPGLKLAAEQALLGGEGAIQKFLDDADSIQYDDNRVEAAQMAMSGGLGVQQAAKEAIRKTPAELEDFLLYGYEESLDDDHKVEIARLTSLGGPGVQAAGKTALAGTADDRDQFLNTGQYEAQQDDNRVEVARLASTGGPNVKAAAKVALRGTAEDMVEFLEIGQFTARNRDQEHASIAELVKQAKTAGKQAEDATKKAKESSKKAITASALAKEAAEKAAAQTQAAKNDSKTAAVKAKQAADAARGAAAAAQEAIGAADAANRAARRAAVAAAQTASAAAAASDAANRAYQAAIAAAGNKADAAAATAAAKQARAAADAADDSIVAAENAGKASAAAAVASRSAKDASGNARAAASAAEEANSYADAAGVHSGEARQAAAEARRYADAADRAANRSAALADRAAEAAYGARDAAKSSAGHARKAADFADEAAEQAGNAATYAATSQKNADAARAAAKDATAAVSKAKEIFKLARETEEADLQTRTEAAIERARSKKAETDTAISVSAATQVQALTLNDTAAELAQDAARPDVDVQATAARGRELAMQAMKLLGPWQQEAAARALSGTDQDVLDYLRTRWKEAERYDIRQRVVDLSSQSPYESVRTAATEALNGTLQQVEDFYTTGQYTAGADDMKVAVARLAETGGTSVSRGAKDALAAGSGKTLAAFLQVGQYGERLTDEKVVTAQLAESGGPEVQAAAKAALAGPPDLIHEFVATGQYMAQRKDDLAAHHVHEVERLIAEGALIAAKANESAWRAAEVAANAHHASADAAEAAAEANKSKKAAEQYAADANASATAAENSAAAAAKSAATARNAAHRAEADATAAENSAAESEFSASYARQSARSADAAAADARASAAAAGKSASEAEAEANAAWKRALDLAEKEIKAARAQAAEERKAQQAAKPKKVCVPFVSRESLIPIMPCVQDPDNSVIGMPLDDPTLRDIVWELTGLNDIKKCIQEPTALGCTMAVVGVTPWGKIKLLKRLEDGVEFIKDARRVRRSTACLKDAGSHSFPAGTEVLLADGSHRPIELIKTGDLVQAGVPTSTKSEPRRVERVIHTPDDRNFIDITLADGSTLTTTGHHPFWAQNHRAWKNAESLQPGDTLRTPQNTSLAIVKARDRQVRQDAYDLTVEDLHTYYVSSGSADVLVHNSDGPTCPLWALEIMDELPTRLTAGKIRTPGNKEFSGLPEELQMNRSGGKSEWTDKANEILYKSGNPHFPANPNISRPPTYVPSTHVETKYAAWMQSREDVKEAYVVINNNEGVCSPRKSTQNCMDAVEEILYDDQVMTVFHPGSSTGTPIRGKRHR